MLTHAGILLLSFAVILVGSELFTNGVEWVGQRLQIAEAAVGSLLAAVGTALPETLIPAVALLLDHKHSQAHQAVGIGAIIGAPLMLSTLALFVMGSAAILFRKRRKQIALQVARTDARRDLAFFVPIFLSMILLGLGSVNPLARHAIALVLLAVYAAYAMLMLRLKRAENAQPGHGLYLASLFRRAPLTPRMLLILLQVALGAGAIVAGAIEFVNQIVIFSHHANLNPGVLSLILSPLATELPEKYNSVVWIRQRKDHLALANITGAMVFQSCIPVALGLAFTPWRLSPPDLLAGAIGLSSAALLFINVRDGELGTPTMLIGGLGYAIFLGGLMVLGVV
ncbi:MAG: sodium:calcium antiporter [Candidatus Binataceae bacterium]